MVDRIKQVMGYEQMSPTAFADKINVNRSSLTHIFSGRNQPSLDIAKKILIAFPEISTEWLIMGMGNMIQDVPVPTETPVPVKNVDNMQQTDLFSGTEDEQLEQPSLENAKTVETEPIVKDQESEDEDITTSGNVERKTQRAMEETVMAPTVVNERTAVVPARTTRGRGRVSESNFSTSGPRRDRISNSQGDKKLVKIVFFYDDRSFEEYRPN